jgi:hypothetical protein
MSKITSITRRDIFDILEIGAEDSETEASYSYFSMREEGLGIE